MLSPSCYVVGRRTTFEHSFNVCIHLSTDQSRAPLFAFCFPCCDDGYGCPIQDASLPMLQEQVCRLSVHVSWPSNGLSSVSPCMLEEQVCPIRYDARSVINLCINCIVDCLTISLPSFQVCFHHHHTHSLVSHSDASLLSVCPLRYGCFAGMPASRFGSCFASAMVSVMSRMVD